VPPDVEPRQARSVRKAALHDGGAGDQAAGEGAGARPVPHGGNVAKMRARLSLPAASDTAKPFGRDKASPLHFGLARFTGVRF